PSSVRSAASPAWWTPVSSSAPPTRCSWRRRGRCASSPPDPVKRDGHEYGNPTRPRRPPHRGSATAVTFFPHHLRLERAAHPALTAELAALLQAIALAGKVVAWEVARAGLTGRLGETGEINVQGEWVKKLDAWANGAVVDV